MNLFEKKKEIFRYNALLLSPVKKPQIGDSVKEYDYIYADSSHFVPLDPIKSSKYFFSKYKKNIISDPIHICLHTVNECSDACRWCYSQSTRLKYSRKNEFIDHVPLLNELLSISNRTMAIYFSGLGEPSTLSNFIELLNIKKTNIDLPAVIVVTNGQKLEKLVNLELLNKINLIRVSLNGYDDKSFSLVQRPKDTYNNYSVRVKKLRELCYTIKKNNLNTIVGWHYLVDEINYKGVSNIIRFAEDIGVDYLQFAYDKYLSTKIKDIQGIHKIIYESSAKVAIPIIGFNNLNVNTNPTFCWFKYKPNIYPDGNIFICPLMNKGNEWSCIGNAKVSFYKTWEENLKSSLFERKIECIDCPFNNFNRIYSWLFERYNQGLYDYIYKVAINNESIELIF